MNSSDRLAPAVSLARLESQYGRLERYFEWPPERLFEVRADVSGWSVGEHLFHVTLANQLSLGNTRSLVLRKGRLIRPCEGLAERAEAVLTRGRIPRGVAQAPRFVRPPAAPQLDVMRQIFDESRALLEEVRARVDEVADAPDCVPHQLLGDLGASRWLRFARLHTAHHLQIMRQLA